MTSPTGGLLSPRLTRRRFLTTTATGLALWQCGERASSQITGLVMPKLATYDDLMTTFMREHRPPGAALAVTYHGRLVYARGFGHADLEKHEPVRPGSLFRIASVSKPFAATAVMHLVEQGKLQLDARVFPMLKLQPHLEPGTRFDPRWYDITVRHCLQHTAGWNRDKSFDPMGAETAEQVAKALRVPLPIHPQQIIRYTMGTPLDFAPGNHATLLMQWNGKTVYVEPGRRRQAFRRPAQARHRAGDAHARRPLRPENAGSRRACGRKDRAGRPQGSRREIPLTLIPERLQGKSALRVLANGEKTEVQGISIEAVPAYNSTPGKEKFHPKGRDNGYVVVMGGKRIYVAGDTEDTPEMRAVRDIDIAFLPMNLPYTMSVEMAAEAIREFKPMDV